MFLDQFGYVCQDQTKQRILYCVTASDFRKSNKNKKLTWIESEDILKTGKNERKTVIGMGNQLNNICQSLDFNSDNGLIMSDSHNMDMVQKNLFMKAHEKLGVDAVYFLRDRDGKEKYPLIYFSSMQYYDSKINAELHKLAWNMGEAPLLFIITPESLIIYDNYESPRVNSAGNLDPRSGLIDEIRLLDGLVSQANELKKYHRSLFESGEFWKMSGKRFSAEGRVDATLLSNLRIMRTKLIGQIRQRNNNYDEKLIIGAVNALLCRSIFIKYLEERKNKNGRCAFGTKFYTKFIDSAEQYTDILKDKEATYTLFRVLKDKFNGDILKDADCEQEIINQNDLDMLRTFLAGECEFEGGQMTLWRLYSFDVIPIHLISSIYEMFYHMSDPEDKMGTYYTPQHLVSMLMDEIYPWDGDYKEISFLDPSCGSGIFLSEAYRRIVYRWMKQNRKHAASGEELSSLLKKSVFGVDINGEAIRVASFSLYLTMCDFLDPVDMWDSLVFPNLINENLFENDFFDVNGKFNEIKYDIVIGNPPWQSNMTDKAREYVKEQKCVVGDKQTAQVFSIKCSTLCKEDGVVCLVMPSKGMLFNRSKTSQKYREQFFADNTVLEIINLTVYKEVLFEHATAPATAVIYIPRRNASDQPVIYCTPKRVYTVEDTRRFSIDPADVCRIPRNAVCDDKIWKIAMFGGPRDFELIHKMQSTCVTLSDYIQKNGMIAAEGFKRGNQKKEYRKFMNQPYIETKTIAPFYVEKKQIRTVDFDRFERTAEQNREIFLAPHLIIKQSPQNDLFLSAVLDYDAVFNHSLLGIHGDIEKLKYLSIMISSEVFSYYHIMVSGRWLIERSELEKDEIMQTPIPEPDKEALKEAIEIFEKSAKLKEKDPTLEGFVRRMYGLNEQESYLINDAIYYTHDALRRKRKSAAFAKPKINEYRLYYKVIKDLLKNTCGSRTGISGYLYTGEAPLSVLMLGMEAKESDVLNIISDEKVIRDLLSDLDQSLQDKSQMIYIRKNLRIYKSDSIYIIKPSQGKYWTHSSACRDGDEIFKDISNAWR